MSLVVPEDDRQCGSAAKAVKFRDPDPLYLNVFQGMPDPELVVCDMGTICHVQKARRIRLVHLKIRMLPR